jgi:dTDP-4-dehydrorhamnose reductase
LNVALERVLGSSLSGLYHAGGPRALSLYEIAQIVNRVGGYDPRLLIGCPRRQAGPIPPRAGNVSLVSDKLATALGGPVFDSWPRSEDWVPDSPEWHWQRGGPFVGSPQFLGEVLYRNPGLRTALDLAG